MATMRCLIFSLLGLFFQLHIDPSISSNDTTPAAATTPAVTTPAVTTPAVTTPAPDPCATATVINDAWRNFEFVTVGNKGNSDSKLKNEWLRFSGIGGDRVINSCKGLNIGGASNNIVINFAYPHVNQTTVSGDAYTYSSGGCPSNTFTVEVTFCTGDFFVYRVASYPINDVGFVTYHFECTAESCGPFAKCSTGGGCVCANGYERLEGVVPTPDSYGCTDIDECAEEGFCGQNTECANTEGGYDCSCTTGYGVTNSSLPLSLLNLCIDTNECLDMTKCENGNCTNSVGSYSCICFIGFRLTSEGEPACEDIDECAEDEGLCGPDATCTNNIGSFVCDCNIGYVPTNESIMAHRDNICIDYEECLRTVRTVDRFKHIQQTLCGPHCNCTNTIGSYYCSCDTGFREDTPDMMASDMNPCTDIDECTEHPGICGKGTRCTNSVGSFYCSCPEKFYPNTGLVWIVGITFCEWVQKRLNELPHIEGLTKKGVFFLEVNDQLDNLTFVPVPTLANGISACMEAADVGPLAETSTVSSAGDDKVGSELLTLCDRLVSRMSNQGYNKTEVSVESSAMVLSMVTFGYGGDNEEGPALLAKENSMEIDMLVLAANNNGSAACAFMVLNGMESLLSHQFFKTENKTEMMSDVVTAVLPGMNNTNISANPVNFTIYHNKPTPEGGMVNCVYWKEEKDDNGFTISAGWSTDGCTITHSNENFTVCTCNHLSTFALILQIAEPPEQNDFLDWLNRICVIVGLFFFALAILTFLLCSWNPKINNTARLHLCLNLGLFHLLMLFVEDYVNDQLACKVLAGLLHFLVVASFVWMQLEAVQLFMLVRKLTKVQVIKRDGLPRPVLYFVGYGVPLLIVGVSAVIYSDGYGPASGTCWLTTERSFNWALTGPVIAVLVLNCLLFGATLWSLRTTIANMRSGASGSKETRLVLFKIIAQFVILGCTWILGLYQSNLFFRVLFIVLNSQQGTFLYVVHCVLNKEIREEYIKWLTCAQFKNNGDKDDDEVKDAPSVSEDLDKTKGEIHEKAS